MEEEITGPSSNLAWHKWYKTTYDSLVNSRKSRGLNKKKLDYYTEEHHIIPKCLGGTNEEDNLVLLTFREHVIAHMLLMRMYPGNTKLSHIVHLMFNTASKKGNNNYDSSGKTVRPSTRLLEEIRIENSKYLSNLFKGRVISKETIEKMKATKKRNGMSERARKAQALGRVGMVFTEERKRKISESMKGKALSRESLLKRSGNRIIDPEGNELLIKEFMEKYNVPRHKIEPWIKEHEDEGFIFKKAEVRKYKILAPNGKIYDSLRSCAKDYGRESKTIKNWIENFPDKGFKYID